MRAILRDSRGKVIMAASIQENAHFNPETVECLTLFKSLQLYLNLNIYHLVVEFDC